ncbi:caspase family protein, partial [Vibrio vulnificus]
MLRKALIIGNQDYADKPLITPVNDANDMSQLLLDKEFDVALHHDLEIESFDREVSAFCESVKGGRFVTLFYFAG